MTEQNLETRIIGKLSAALGTLAHGSTGAWQFASQLTPEECDALLEVEVSPRSYEIETTPAAAFAVTVRVTVRRELDINPLDYLEPVQALLQTWQGDYDQAASDLNGDDLEVVGFTLNGGTLDSSAERSAFVWEQTANVRGIIVSTTEQE